MTLALQNKSWGGLPDIGGLLDQEYGLLNRMTLAYNVFQAFHEAQKAPNLAEWAEKYPDSWDVITWVKELRRDENPNGR